MYPVRCKTRRFGALLYQLRSADRRGLGGSIGCSGGRRYRSSTKAAPDTCRQEDRGRVHGIRGVLRHGRHADAADLGGAAGGSTASGADRVYRIVGRAAEGIRQFIARITICLEEVEAQARIAARAERTSVERWIAERIVSVGLEEPYRWKDSVQSGDEIRLWMADGVAHNLRPWTTKFNAKPIDAAGFRWSRSVTAGITGMRSTFAMRSRWLKLRWFIRSRGGVLGRRPGDPEGRERFARLLSGSGGSARSFRHGARSVA